MFLGTYTIYEILFLINKKLIGKLRDGKFTLILTIILCIQHLLIVVITLKAKYFIIMLITFK